MATHLILYVYPCQRQLAHTLNTAEPSCDSEIAQGSSMCLSKVSKLSTCPSSEKRHERCDFDNDGFKRSRDADECSA